MISNTGGLCALLESRYLDREVTGYSLSSIPPVLHGILHVLPGDASLVGRLRSVRISILILHRYHRFVSLHVLQCHPASHVVVPSMALRTGILLQYTVPMHESRG